MTPPLVAACAPAVLSDIACFVLAIAAASLALLRDARYTLNIATLLINVTMARAYGGTAVVDSTSNEPASTRATFYSGATPSTAATNCVPVALIARSGRLHNDQSKKIPKRLPWKNNSKLLIQMTASRLRGSHPAAMRVASFGRLRQAKDRRSLTQIKKKMSLALEIHGK
jgi:hypothetical protein